jgi:DNA processing protein
MQQELVYQIALTTVPNIGPVQAKLLVQQFGSASGIFQARRSTLERTEGIGSIRAGNIKNFNDFSLIEEEIAFLEKYQVKPLFLSDKDYPQRLLNCYDPPVLLYYKGKIDLNASRSIAVIGTRNNTDYGRQAAEKLIAGLAVANVLIISGLAFGIDAIAHRAALKNALPTVGVLAHGLDTIYPPQHSGLARDMLQHGGLLTEFPGRTKPDRHHFPMRNRIVAGMCDAVVVIETGTKGGSLITADLANGYHRDVFALPGRTTDGRSAGCNHLIRHHRAMLLTDAQDLLQVMGWEPKTAPPKTRQRELFLQLTEEEKFLMTMLESSAAIGIDEINIKSNMSSSKVASALLNLELQGLVSSLPGKMYRLT